jgi:large subunit GTPase 1
MPQAKSKNSVGLGNTLMNDRFGKGKGTDRRKTSAVVRTNHITGEQVRELDVFFAPTCLLTQIT